MTKIYCYCLFDRSGNFRGVYSSENAVHRDALKLCNKGGGKVVIEGAQGDSPVEASATALRNILKGAFDVQVIYTSGHAYRAHIIKTKLKE